MRKQLIVLFTAMALLLPVGTAFAGSDSEGVTFTGKEVVQFPFKVVGGALGFVVGAVAGSASGAINEWSSVNKKYEKQEPVWLRIPVGIISVFYAVPVGAYKQAPSEALATAKDYYNWLD
ncbi:MAG TPA: hypothetical protein EYQ55_01755 [Methylococcaceae bacterium]|nr:hypothetical protein [Methylococcaceae bacterium]